MGRGSSTYAPESLSWQWDSASARFGHIRTAESPRLPMDMNVSGQQHRCVQYFYFIPQTLLCRPLQVENSDICCSSARPSTILRVYCLSDTPALEEALLISYCGSRLTITYSPRTAFQPFISPRRLEVTRKSLG